MRGKRTSSALVALGCAALVAGGVVTPAAAWTPLVRVELGRVNVISGDAIAGMEVRIPRPATIEADPFSNRNVSYDGPGRIVGIVLVEEGAPVNRAFQVVSVQWTFCGEPGCKGKPYDRTEITTTSRWGPGKRWKIPAGDYRLYLVADGAPVDVTLRLDGLDGETALRPSGAVAGRIAAPTATVPAPTGHVFLGRARPVVLPTAGLLIDGDTTGFVEGPSVGARGSCFWRGQGEEDVEHSTPGPHCLRFTERGGFGFSTTTLGGGWSTWGLGNVPPGKWRSSYWATDVTAFPASDFLTLWLAYEEPRY